MSYGNYPDLRSVERILVVKLRHLGDVLLTTPVFGALKKALPHARIDAYIYQEAFPMLEGHPALSEIIGYDRNWKKLGWLGRLRKEAEMLQRIRRKRYDLVINLTEGDRGALAARLSHAKVRVGVDARKIYTHVVKNCPSLRHTVERQLDALRRIGIFPDTADRELVLIIPESAREAMRQKISWERFILIHPTSRWRFKCWPVHSVASLARRLIDRGERLVFTSGPDPEERAMVDEIVRPLPRPAIMNLAGLISLKELAALIERCAALVSVDSVPLHMASALKAPVVALFGPSSEVTWGPWRNPKARVVAHPMSCRPCYLDGCGGGKVSDCLHAISVESVLSELEVVAEVRSPGLRVVH
jgi:heptosyltransferase III